MMKTAIIIMVLSLFTGGVASAGIFGLDFANVHLGGGHHSGGGGGPVCATGFVFDWSDTTGCQSITAVIR